MRIVILAAGLSRRFQEAGYQTPKPFLNIEWRGWTQPMLMHVLRSVPLQFEDVTIAIPTGWLERAREITATYERVVKFIEIEHSTGPASTAKQTLLGFDDKATLFLDCDIINHPNDLWVLCCLNCCGVLVSNSTNPAFSYVTNTGSFFHIKEKQRISPYAVRGAYFVPTHMMKSFVMWMNIVISNEQEPFISHIFDMLPDSKFALETTYDPIDWGTPLDVKLSSAKIITEGE
jgi:molybdopterin-guanine dinucleotide biosynthesis protein A